MYRNQPDTSGISGLRVNTSNDRGFGRWVGKDYLEKPGQRTKIHSIGLSTAGNERDDCDGIQVELERNGWACDRGVTVGVDRNSLVVNFT